MRCQLLLMSDGISHRLLGMGPYYALKDMGVDAGAYFPARGLGAIDPSADVTFVLKPSAADVAQIRANVRGALALIINDMRLDPAVERAFDFFVSPSVGWRDEYLARHPDKPCYLVREELNHWQPKAHAAGPLRIVAHGYHQNMVHHLAPILPAILAAHPDVTIIGNFGGAEDAGLPECFRACNLVPSIHHRAFVDPDFDEPFIRQFEHYDVGIVTQYRGAARTSNRVKALMYAGLPVVASRNGSHDDLWFGRYGEIVHQAETVEDWLSALDGLRNPANRQRIADHNLSVVSQQGGHVRSAGDFLAAIEAFRSRS